MKLYSTTPSELFPSAPLYQFPIVLSYTNNLFAPHHVSCSPYGFLVLQPTLQLPIDHQQRFGRIQEAHKERNEDEEETPGTSEGNDRDVELNHETETEFDWKQIIEEILESDEENTHCHQQSSEFISVSANE